MALFGNRGKNDSPGGLISSNEPKVTHGATIDSPRGRATDNSTYLRDYENSLADQAKQSKEADKAGDISGKERANSWQYRKQEARDARQTAMGGVKKGGAKWKIISIIATGSIGLGAIFGPGAIAAFGIEQFFNMMDRQFGSNLQALTEKRANRIFLNRIDDSKRTPSLKGLCGVAKVACRYGGMSNRQIKNFEKRTGAKIERGSGIQGKIPGRSNIQSITLANGDNLTAQQFHDRLLSNSPEGRELRSTMRFAMKSKTAVWFNAKMTALFSKLGIDKLGGFIKEKTVDKVKEKIKSRQAGSGGTKSVSSSNSDTGDEAADEEARRANAAASSMEETLGGRIDGQDLDLPDGVSTDDISNAFNGNLATSVATGVLKSVQITGYADIACTGLNTISAVGYISKALGSQQLIKFSATMASSRDGWKSGAATQEGFWDGLSRIFFGKDPITGKNAFESAGYAMTTGQAFDPLETLEFRTGGGLVGELVKLKDMLLDAIPGGQGSCDVIQNPFTRIGSTAIGIVAAFFSGGTITAGQVISGAVLQTAISVALAFLIPVAANILTGDLVSDDIQGQAAGNATTSGEGARYGQNANAQGMSVMTKEQAMQNDLVLVQPYLAETQADDRNNAGLFALDNPYSLVGSVMSGWLPYMSDNALTTVMNFGALAANPLGLIDKALSPQANAATATNYFDICADSDYETLKIAVDPFCNPVFGIPDENLTNMNPDDVMLWMMGPNVVAMMSEPYIPSKQTAGPSHPVVPEERYIDDDGNPIGGTLYADFVKNCAENIYPFGTKTDETSDYIKNPNCMFNSGYYPDMFYMYYFDDSVYQMMECTQDEEDGACYGQSSADSTAAAGDGAIISGNPSELANQVLALGNDGTITIMPGPKQELNVTAGGSALSNGKTLSPDLLAFIIEVTKTIKAQHGITMQINAIAGPINSYNPSSGHSATSKHYQGLAVDFQCRGDNSTVRSVLDSVGSKYGVSNQRVKSIRGETCDGASNQHWHYSIGGS